MAVDISFLTYLAPIFAFLIVFVVSFAVLIKTKIIGEDKWVGLIVSLVIASLFVSSAGAKEYVINIVPWFASLLILLFFILILTGFAGGVEGFNKGIGIGFSIMLFLIFLVVGFVLFSSVIGPIFSPWVYSERVVGASVLIFVSALVAWVLMKGAGKK